MTTGARHSLARTACTALILALSAITAIARQTGSAPLPPPGPAAAPAAPASSPQLPAPLAQAAAPLPPQPAAAFIPQGPLIQHRERGNLVFDGIPPPDAGLAARLARYQQSRGATFLDWLADGSLIASTRFGDTEQVHRVNAPLGMREQLTFYSDPIEWARGAKSGKGFVFLMDHAGDDNAQVYYHPGSGEPKQLTHGSFIHGSTVWAHDGKRVAFYGNDRDSLSYDVYVADVTSNAAPQLVVGGRADTWYPLDWSPDDSKLLVWRYLSSSESYLYLADVATGTLTPLEQKPLKAGIRMAKFDPAGRGVYVVTDEDSEFAQLKFKDLITHDNRRVSPDVSWDVEDFDVSADGRYIAYVLNEDGRSRLALLDRESKQTLAPAGLPEGRIGNPRFDRTGRRLAMTVDSPTSPRDVWVYEIEKDSVTRWTHSEAGPLDVAPFVAPELVRYPTWDRVGGHERRLSAYVYRPAQASGPVPVLIDIHGGPEAQYRPEWDPFVQFLVNELGYARLIRLRQDLSHPRQRRVARGRGARYRLAAGVDRCAERIRSRPRGGNGRLLRRLHGACSARHLRRPAAWRRRSRRHQRLRHVPAQHLRLPARLAADRVWRRTRHQHEGIPRAHLPAHQRGAHPQAGAGCRRPERSARPDLGIRATRVARALGRRRSVVPGGEGRGARVPEETEP